MAFGGLLAAVAAVPLVAGFEEMKILSDIFSPFQPSVLQKRVAWEESVKRGNVKGREERDNVPRRGC